MTRASLSGLLRYLAAGGRRERVEVARIVVLALVAEVALRLVALPRVARAFGADLATGAPVAAGAASGDDAPGHLDSWAWRHAIAVRTVMAAWPGDGLCLRESLVLSHRLRSLQPELRIGVRRTDGVVQAHAWLVVQGVELGAEDYAVMRDPRLGSAT